MIATYAKGRSRPSARKITPRDAVGMTSSVWLEPNGSLACIDCRLWPPSLPSGSPLTKLEPCRCGRVPAPWLARAARAALLRSWLVLAFLLWSIWWITGQTQAASGIPLGEALDAPNLPWRTNGHASWFPQTVTAHDGVEAAQSGPITNNQQTWLETPLEGPGDLAFWWKVSSAAFYGILIFYVDDVEQWSISGEVDWEPRAIELGAGPHRLRWTYTKSDDYSLGWDAAWLDEVTWIPTNTMQLPIILRQPRNAAAALGTSNRFDLVVKGSLPLHYQWRFAGTNLPGRTNADLELPGVAANQAGRYSVVVSNAFGTATSEEVVLQITPVAAWGDNTCGQIVVPLGLKNTAALASSYLHSLALQADGTVAAWGDNLWGEADVPASLSNVVAVATGAYHSLALQNDGTPVAWGSDFWGQCSIPEGLSRVLAVSAGWSHSLALRSDGRVVAWGDNDSGQTNVPANLSNVVAISAGYSHNLALRSDGRVIAWGDNCYGQTEVPADLSNVVAVAAGGDHSLALRRDGRVVAWGDDYYGQTDVPMDLSNVVTVAAGGGHSLALRSDGNVVAWGDDSFSQAAVPPDLSNVVAVAAGWSHSLAMVWPGGQPLVLGGGSQTCYSGESVLLDMVAAGRLPLRYQWSFKEVTLAGATNAFLFFEQARANQSGPYTLKATDREGAIGFNTVMLTVQEVCPIIVTPPGSQTLFPGQTLRLTVQADGSKPLTYQWQFGEMDLPGQTNSTLVIEQVSASQAGSYRVIVRNPVGTNNAEATLAFKQVAAWGASQSGQCNVPLGLTNIAAIAAGFVHSLALRGDGKLVAWGDNSGGQTNLPVGVGNVVAVAAGGYHSLALQSDGKVVAWGFNGSGQTDVPERLSNVVAVAAGGDHSLALRGDGTVVAWGFNGNGETKVPVGLRNVVEVAAGEFHSLALLSNGTVVGWGFNGDGQISVPVGLTNVVAVAAGRYHSLALRRDGTTVGWGGSTSGQARVPVGLSNVVAVVAGRYHSLALRRDGTAVGWGWDGDGQANVPAGLSNVVAIAAGGYHSLALVAFGTPPLVLGSAIRTCYSGAPILLDVTVAGRWPLRYQWSTNGIPLAGATNVFLLLPPAQAPQTQSWRLDVIDATGSASNYVVTLVLRDMPPFIVQAPLGQTLLPGQTLELAVSADGSKPLAYQWLFEGAYLPGRTNAELVLPGVTGSQVGNYSVEVSNAFGRATNQTVVKVSVVVEWGTDVPGQQTLPSVLTNIVAIATGSNNLALRGDGTVAAWGESGCGQTNVPAGLSNVVAVAAGLTHCLALRDDGTVVAWGDNSVGQATVPACLGSVVGIAAGRYHSLALRSDGTVAAWGFNGDGQTSVPVGLGHVVAVAAGTAHNLALRSDGTVVAWGFNGNGEIDVPVGLSDMVAVTAGGYHNLALRRDGKVVAWGANSDGQTNVPPNLTNAVAVTAGRYHSLALRSDGTIIAWGSSTAGQTNVPAGLGNVVAIAAGPAHNLALVWSGGRPLVLGTGSWACDGGDAVQLHVTVAGRLPLHYQWRTDEAWLPGATNAFLLLEQTRTNQSGLYTVEITDGGGFVSTQVVMLTIRKGLDWYLGYQGPWRISWESPWTGEEYMTLDGAGAAQSGTCDSLSWLETAVDGPVMVSFWWQVSSAACQNGLDFSVDGVDRWRIWGEVSWQPKALTLGPGCHTLRWAYTRDGTTAGGQDRGWLDEVRVIREADVPPAILGQPQSSTNAPGIAAAIEVIATGSLPLGYRWLFNGTEVAGGTNAVLTIPDPRAAQAGDYWVVLSNAWGMATSTVVRLTVTSELAEALEHLGPWNTGAAAPWYGQTNVAYDGVDAAQSGASWLDCQRESRLETSFQGPGRLSFWWKLSSPLDRGKLHFSVDGVVQVQLALETDWQPWALDLDQGNHTVKWTLTNAVSGSGDAGTRGWLDEVWWMTNGPPIILKQPLDVAVHSGCTAHLEVLATGGPPLRYQWLFNSMVIVGATNANLWLTNARADQAGWYQVVVSNPSADVMSREAVLTVTSELADVLGCARPWVSGPWITGCDPAWYGQTNVTRDGRAAAQSGIVHHNQQTWIETPCPGPGCLSFWWKGASFANDARLGFSIDGVELYALTNDMDWQPRAVVLDASPSSHTLRWTLQNGGVAWLNEVCWVGTTSPPTILARPQDLMVALGCDAKFDVVATGGLPLAYQWLFNEAPIPGATNATLTLTNTRADQAGRYEVVVSNVGGVMNAFADLTVTLELTNVLRYAGFWRTGCDASWYGQTNVTYDQTGAAQSWLVKDSQQSWLETDVLGPASLSFLCKVSSEHYYDWLSFSTDGVEQWRISGEVNWRPQNVELPEGMHTLRWAYTKDTNFSFGLDAAWLDEVSLITTSNIAPIILWQPQALTVTFGGTALFEVVARGSSPLAYCWKGKGEVLSGATNAILTLTNVRATQGGEYRVQVSNAAGQETSAGALLEVAPVAVLGLDCFFGDPPGLPRNLTNLTAVAAGWWHNIALRTDGTVAGWGWDHSGQMCVPAGLRDVVAVAAGGYQSLALRTDGTVVAWGWDFGGQTDVPEGLSNVIAIATGGSHGLALRNNGTVAAWGGDYCGQSDVPADLSNVVAVAAGGDLSLALRADGTVVAWGDNYYGQAVVPRGLSNVVAIATGGTHSLALQSDGTVVAWGTDFAGEGEVPLTLGNVVAVAAGSQHSLALRADGKVFAWGDNTFAQANVPLDLTNVVGISDGGTHSLALLNIGSPVLTVQPLSQTVVASNSTTLHARAAGNGRMTFQWRLQGTNIAGATNVSLLLANVQLTDAGSYSVVVSNAQGVVTSRVASVTVLAPPSLSEPPDDQKVLLGADVTFTISAMGTPPLVYQWRKNGVNIPGATNDNLTITNVQLPDGGSYSVVVANALGAKSSDPALLLIDVPVVTPGDDFTNRVSVTGFSNSISGTNLLATRELGEPWHAGRFGSNSVWYSWAAPASGIATFRSVGSSFDTLLAVYSGTNLSSLQTVASDEDRGGFLTSQVMFNAVSNETYQIAVDGFVGKRGPYNLSWTLAVTTNMLPVISLQPSNQTLTLGSTGALSVVATGSGLIYQWYFNRARLNGATNRDLVLTNLQGGNAGFYTVGVTNEIRRGVMSLPAAVELGSEAGSTTQDKVEDWFLGIRDSTGHGGKSSTVACPPYIVASGQIGFHCFGNSEGTTSADEPNHCGQICRATRWLYLQAINSARLVVDTAGSTIPTVLAIYENDATCGYKLNSEVCACPATSSLESRPRAVRDVTAGMEFAIAADGLNQVVGQIQLNWALGVAPVVSNQCVNQTVSRNEPLRLTAHVNAPIPAPIYQWKRDGVSLPGQTNLALETTGIGATDEGVYSVLVSNVIDTVEATIATVRLEQPTTRLLHTTFESQEIWGLKTNAFPMAFGPTNGNPGGCLFVRATNALWYWIVPFNKLESLASAYGGWLVFDLNDSASVATNQNEPLLQMTGGGLTLVYFVSHFPATISSGWRTYRVHLQETSPDGNGIWCKEGSGGARPSKEEMCRVLESLSELLVRGRTMGGCTTGRLDNVSVVLVDPRLSIDVTDGRRFVLAWPRTTLSYQLQSASSLVDGVWTTNCPGVMWPPASGLNWNWVVAEPMGRSRFFRLIKTQ